MEIVAADTRPCGLGISRHPAVPTAGLPPSTTILPRSTAVGVQFTLPRVIEVHPEKDHRLALTFSNGESGIYDCAPLLDFGVFQELRDENYFRQARAFNGTVVWPNEQDICPDTLYLDSVRESSLNESSETAVQPR